MRTPQSELERRRLNERGRQILRKKTGGAVRPMREDGYVNLLNKYGTTHDNSESYGFEREPLIPDMQLTSLYEGNGLFTKIIDAPAEEALKHGFDLRLKNDELDAFVEEALDDLEWEEKAATAIKWARLYGGAIIVMLIDDGRGLEEPVDWKSIRSIDELRVYERAIVQPDTTSLYTQDIGGKGAGNRVSKFGQPEFYYVSSIYGSFKVHESRCLVFRNGVLPELVSDSTYLFWGMPEYVRIRRALRETITSHTDATKMLERSVQAIYSMKGLAALLTTDDGENAVLKRLQVIDMARGLLNSIAIDSEGESYDFKVAQFSGVKDVIDATCNMLSALTNIPQTILFGRSPAGENSTGESDMENWYSFVERIQKLMLKRNLRNLLDVVFRAGVYSGEIEEEPDYKLKFNPLWSLSDTEQATVDQTKAQAALAKAQATQIYVDMQAIDPSEVRTALAADGEYNVEDVVAEDEDEDLLKSLMGSQPNAMAELEAEQKSAEELKAPGGTEQTAPAPGSIPEQGSFDAYVKGDSNSPTGVGVLVVIDGEILCGTRAKEGTIGGPGGHIEAGETPEQAAVRESQEEFGITPKELIPVTTLTGMPEQYGVSQVFLCTEYDGHIACDGEEMVRPGFLSMEKAKELMSNKPERLFEPFRLSIDALLTEIFPNETAKDDGGPGSGNFGHSGRVGKVGGSTSGDRTPVSHEIASPAQASDKIKECAKKAMSAGISSSKEVKKALFDETQNRGLPQLSPPDEFDKIESDHPTVYRGFDEPEYLEQFMNGESYVGSGFAGSGTNVAIEPSESETYGGDNVLEMKLSKGAKVISEDELMPLYAEVRNSTKSGGASDEEKFASWLGSDPGCVAAALGYDAIYSDLHGWFNVINRSQLIVKKKGDG